MTLPSRTPSRRALRAYYWLGVLAGAMLATAAILRHLPTH
jgi:hypothetical protein